MNRRWFLGRLLGLLAAPATAFAAKFKPTTRFGLTTVPEWLEADIGHVFTGAVGYWEFPLRINQLRDIRADDRRLGAIGAAFGISKATVCRVRNHQLWAHVP